MNHGTIYAESMGSSWNSFFRINENGTLTNAATGTIEVNLGTGGGRRFEGTGAWTVHNFGDITVTDIDFPMLGGTFRHGGGMITGGFRIENADIAVEATATTPTTVELNRTCTLLENESTAVDLWVRGRSGIGDSILVVGDVTNRGSIRCESTGSSWDSRLFVAEDATFTNGAAGTIDINTGTGGPRWINGTGDWTVRNLGTIDIEPSEFSIINGTYEHAGGSISGEMILDDCSIAIESSATTAATLIAVQSCRLLEHESTDVTLWVRGQSSYGDAVLNVTGVTNRGHIVLESINSTWDCNLSVEENETFVNGAAGIIDINFGIGGPRIIAGSGLWSVQNHGAINVESGILSTTTGVGLVFEQLGGAITCDGELRITSADFVHSGGAIIGELHLAGCALFIESTATIPATIIANQSCTLAQHDSPDITVWVQGRSGLGNALLFVPTLTVHGGILTESIDTSWVSRVVVDEDATVTLATTATYECNTGLGGDRFLSGSGNWGLTNHGIIDIEPGSGFAMFNGALSHVEGDILGEFIADDCTLTIASSAIEPCTIHAEQNCRLLQHDAPNVNLWVRGRSIAGNAQLLCQFSLDQPVAGTQIAPVNRLQNQRIGVPLLGTAAQRNSGSL